MLAQATQGPYSIAMSVMPPQPTAGKARVLVRVCDASSGQPVEGMEVALWPVSPDGVQIGVIYAMSRFGGPGDYGAEITVRKPGAWMYRVELDGPKGKASFEVPLQIREISSYGGALPTVVFLGFSGALLAGAFYLVSRARQTARALS